VEKDGHVLLRVDSVRLRTFGNACKVGAGSSIEHGAEWLVGQGGCEWLHCVCMSGLQEKEISKGGRQFIRVCNKASKELKP